MMIHTRRSWQERLLAAIVLLLGYLYLLWVLRDSPQSISTTAQLGYALMTLIIAYWEIGTFKIVDHRLALSNDLKIWLALVGSTIVGMLLLESWPETVMATLTSRGLLWNTMIALSTGIFEETITRGLLFSVFLQAGHRHQWRLKFTQATIFSSLIFGTLHLTNLGPGNVESVLQQVFYTFVLGVLLSILRVTTNTLFWPIGLHFLIDWQPDIATSQGPPSADWWVIGTIFSVILIVGLIYLIKFDRADERRQVSLSH
jgi:membrane protease YdiL (CAAX protease family)